MWSLYENKNNESILLKPLVFSNQKSQEDVVKEIIQEINNGHKIIFIKGVCGTGKSAIALNLANHFKKASIVVPVKGLQKQYELDYTNKKFILKENKEKLKIKIITGRKNFECPYLKENQNILEKFKSNKIEKIEKNTSLSDFSEENRLDIFDTPKIEIQEFKDTSCNNSNLPCKIEIKEKNAWKIKRYLNKNKKIKNPSFMNLSKVRRLSIAPVCPYWSPLVPADIDINILKDAVKKDYTGLEQKPYIFYKRKSGCGYYDQYDSYINSDVLIFNSLKYKLETIMNRKPATEIEIIDECDEFLDSLSNYKTINLNRLYLSLGMAFTDNENAMKTIHELEDLTRALMKSKKINEQIFNYEILHIKETKISELLQYFLNSNFMDFLEIDEENYLYHCEEVAKTFDNFLDETFVSFTREDKFITVRLITTNLEKKFKELVDKNKIIVMMSGTLHSESVLKNIFGLKDFKIIEAETKTPGTIEKLRTGFEVDCKYSNFQNGKTTRAQYLLALEECIKKAKPPILVHVNAFKDLPTQQEIEQYNLNIMGREKLLELQQKDKTGKVIEKFKKGEIKILYSTKCNRGVDFPGETCNSIILTKFPYPNIQSIFWKILKKTKPQFYNNFYMDKARREFLQRIYRALRSKTDHIFLLSPDVRVMNAVIY